MQARRESTYVDMLAAVQATERRARTILVDDDIDAGLLISEHGSREADLLRARLLAFGSPRLQELYGKWLECPFEFDAAWIDVVYLTKTNEDSLPDGPNREQLRAQARAAIDRMLSIKNELSNQVMREMQGDHVTKPSERRASGS